MALLVVGALGLSVLTGSGVDVETLGQGDLGLGTGDDADGDAGTDYGATGDDSYESDDRYGTGTYDDGTGVYDNETGAYDDNTGSYDSAGDIGTEPAPSVPEDMTSTSTPDGSVVLPYEDAWANGVETTFNLYFEGINSGDAQLAWMQFSPGRQQQSSLDAFAEAVRTSHDSGFVVQAASYAGGRADVWLEFTSMQDPALGPNPGEGCTMWSLDYVLVEQSDGTFLIDDVASHGGTTGHSAC